MAKRIKRVVILGGGTAGWITAAMLARELGESLDICLVESKRLGTIGVGEATVPSIKALNSGLGLDEKAFIKRVNATFKLGIRFEGWGTRDAYMHAFGELGKDQAFCPFHHFVVRSRLDGAEVDLWDYSLTYQAAIRNRFAPLKPHPEIPALEYAYHFDATLYADLLKQYAVARGVRHVDAMVEKVKVDESSGDVESLILSTGEAVPGDLFVDCTGFRALLIEKTLGVDFIDWDRWLPCNRAIAAQTKSAPDLRPYTRSIAKPGGWQWRIPLQNRMGNGLVYSSQVYDESEAEQIFLDGLESAPTTELNFIRFRVGVRSRPWYRNVVAIGLSGGFLEPLESTSIHLIHAGVLRLLWCFPHDGVSVHERDEYNAQVHREWEHVRDFIILHYHLNTRDDSELWRHCADMAIPDSLAHRIELYRDTGKILPERDVLFRIPAWLQVLEGQGVQPRQCHPVAAAMAQREVGEMLDRLRQRIAGPLDAMPSHSDFIRMLK